jgi:hypothetical protein
MAETIRNYIKQAESVLEGNWTGSFTMPSKSLYPHQWNWDSGFISIGYSHFNTSRAMEEMRSLFRGQWKNGLLPQIVFNEQKLGTYFPEPDFWQTENSPDSPDGVLTSGITMPPIHAVTVLKIYENAKNPKDVLPFLEWIYPRLIALHRYLYEERDPEGIGLAYIRHPWESGMDNSPMWDAVFEKVDMSAVTVPSYQRKDLLTEVKADMRPRDEDYDRFIYLVDIFRRHGYNEKEIRKECPFLVYGPLFNAVLCASNEALIKIAHILKKPSREAQEWYNLTKKAIGDRLYHEDHGMFDFFDIRQGKLLDVDTAAGFLPLFCGAASHDQALTIYRYLNSRSFCALHQGNCFTIPNYDTQKEEFDRVNYWRGPVWININWFLMHGLRRYGFNQKADAVAKDILQLPMRFGFHEYYDSFSGRGYGSKDFSWTAALFIDIAFDVYEKTGEMSMFARVKKKLWTEVILNDEKETADIPLERLSQEILSTMKELKVLFYTEEGIVDYREMKRSEKYGEYRKLTARLREYDLSLLKEDRETLAFWINLYNSIVVDGIIALGIKSSVREVMGFFTKIKYTIGGYRFSPDDIEHGILRGNARHPIRFFRQFGPVDRRRKFRLKQIDPRIHFALVCGSRSCAPIKFYTPEGIDEELEGATLNFVNSSEVITIPEENKLVISMIFRWYANDFGGRPGILDFIVKYLVDDDRKEFIRKEANNLTIEYLYYDWNLNK